MAYENFMCNKDFHPSNFRNQRKLYEAEERKKAEVKRQEDLRQQYLKEQELYSSRELLGRAHPLSFMYEPPPGYAKDEDKQKVAAGEDGSQLQLKFDWQKPGRAAPREDFAKDLNLRDKPFGVEVRNVKCVKCGKWGHVNTDRECPLFGKARPQPSEGEPVRVPLPDLDTMEDGLIFRQCVRDRVVDSGAGNQQFVVSGDEEVGEVGALLAGFSKKEQRKILRKLAKMDAKGGKGTRKRHKHRRRARDSDSESSEEGGSGDKEGRRRVSNEDEGSGDREGRRRVSSEGGRGDREGRRRRVSSEEGGRGDREGRRRRVSSSDSDSLSDSRSKSKRERHRRRSREKDRQSHKRRTRHSRKQ